MRNPFDLARYPEQVNEHRQPYASKRVFEKVKELPRRSKQEDSGYDAIGVVLIGSRNDGTEVVLHQDFGDGTPLDTMLTYQKMIERISALYASRFKSL